MTAAKLRETVFYAVGGTLFAFGMEWITSSANPRAKASTIRHARAMSATHIAWVPTENVAGLARCGGRKEASFLAPWRSAATVFAALPWGSLLGVFTFQDGKCWVIAVQNGQVFSDTDIIFDDEAEAKRVFEAIYARQYWENLFAPASWGGEGEGGVYKRAKQIDLTVILRGEHAHAEPKGRLGRLIQRIGLVSAPGVALRLISQSDFALPRIKDRKQLAKIAAAGIMVFALGTGAYVVLHKKKPVITALPRPFYPVVASAPDLIAACLDELPRALIKAVTPGWAVGHASCSIAGTAIELRAADYTALSSLAIYHPQQTDLPPSRTTVIRADLSHKVGDDTIDADTMTDVDFIKVLVPIAERSEGRPELGALKSPAGVGPRDAAGRERPRPYQIMGWSFETAAPPFVWQAELGAIRNITVTSIEMTQHAAKAGDATSTGVALAWKLTGEAYVSN